MPVSFLKNRTALPAYWKGVDVVVRAGKKKVRGGISARVVRTVSRAVSLCPRGAYGTLLTAPQLRSALISNRAYPCVYVAGVANGAR